jgi:endonuclease YncB( thermonuclease family)
MKRRHALLLAALITGLVASNLAILEIQQQDSKTQITIARVIDGDTIETSEGETLRLLNINTPEKNKPGYNQATNYLKQYENHSVLIEDLGADKYQRTLARIYTQEGAYIKSAQPSIPSADLLSADQNGLVYLNLKIIQEGLAVKFLVDESETKTFAQAETQAIQQQKGIWTHAPEFNCIQSEIDEKAEVITLTNTCSPIQLKDWFLKDESRKTYAFQDITLTNTIALHSGKGNDNQENFYWNLNTNVWNNDRDTLYLFDNQARIVHTKPYGY